ncbi:MAG: hypothetical protein ACXAEB_02165 [Candidatus Thorarchaeota archaeon]
MSTKKFESVYTAVEGLLRIAGSLSKIDERVKNAEHMFSNLQFSISEKIALDEKVKKVQLEQEQFIGILTLLAEVRTSISNLEIEIDTLENRIYAIERLETNLNSTR